MPGEFVIRLGSPSGIFIYWHWSKPTILQVRRGKTCWIIRKEMSCSCLSGPPARSATSSTKPLAPTQVWQISRKQFMDYMQSHPEALAPLLDMTIEMYRLHKVSGSCEPSNIGPSASALSRSLADHGAKGASASNRPTAACPHWCAA